MASTGLTTHSPEPDPSPWRGPLSRCWATLAVESIDERRAAQQFVWPRRALRRASRRLCDLIAPSSPRSASKADALAVAALALEGTTAAIDITMDLATPLRVRLIGRLHAALEEHERLVLAGERTYRITPAEAHEVSRAANHAFLVLRAGQRPADRSQADLETYGLALAGLSVQAALNMASGGDAAGPRRPGPDSWGRHAIMLAHEAHTHATAVRARRPPERRRDAWCREALALSLSEPDTRIAVEAVADRSLRADALVALRGRWMRRAALEFGALGLRCRTSGRHESRTVHLHAAALAAELITDGRLWSRPDRFDHVRAWAAANRRLSDGLTHLVDEASSSDLDRTILINLSRCLTATALIDAQLGDRSLPSTIG